MPRIIVPDERSGDPASERDPEVRQVGVALLVEQDVPGLHVPVHDALTMRRRERGGHLVQDRRRSLAARAAPPEQVLDAAASEEPHDEIGGIRLSPVVVERNDVRVLELGDDLRLALEAADEVRMVRELGRDRLDRDLAADLRLGAR